MLFVLLHSVTRPDCTWIPLSSFDIPFFSLPCFQAWHPSSLCLSVLLGLSMTRQVPYLYSMPSPVGRAAQTLPDTN